MLILTQPVNRLDTPYPVCYFDDAMEPPLWVELARTFPSDDKLHELVGMGSKNHLCDRDPPFARFVRSVPLWNRFHNYLITEFQRICDRVFGLKYDPAMHSQFEWSSLPGQGGEVRPHPDSQYKIATAVMFFNTLDWKPEWGGAFEVLRHKTLPDEDWTDRQPPWSDVETIMDIPVQPNRILFMQRTPNSLHGVRPLQAPMSRRTITVNLMKVGA